MCIQYITKKAGGFGLLVIGPGYIPANEVSLFFLVETILGEYLVNEILNFHFYRMNTWSKDSLTDWFLLS